MEYKEWESKEYKQRKTAELQELDLGGYDLVHEEETRLLEYISEVRDNPDGHNLYEILAALRFLRFQRQYVWRWSAVLDFTDLYESLKFSSPTVRQSHRLTPVQFFQFAAIKGFWYWADAGEAEPGDNLITASRRVKSGRVEELRRLTQKTILFVPRKFSKTTAAAALAIEEILFGEANAQAYVAANSYKQARICFNEIRKCMLPLDPGRVNFKITRENIRWRDNNDYGMESFIECLTGGADSKDGLSASLVIYDEYAAAKYTKDHSVGAELLNVLVSSMGMRKDPLVILITTASRITDGPFIIELENAMAVLRGEINNDHLFASLFMPDAWEGADDYGSPKLWRKVNPHIGTTVLESFYANAWRDAQDNAENMLEFKPKLLNVFSSSSTQQWITASDIVKLQRPFHPHLLQDRPATMASIDLSIHDDFSAVGYVSYERSNARFWVWADFYIPEVTLWDHSNRELYRYWVNAGHMKVCPGAVISPEMIVNDVLERNLNMQILQIGYDSYKSQEVVNALAAAISSTADPKDILRPVPQTYGAFTSPVESFEYAVRKDPPSVVFCENPILPYCFENCFIDEDRNGNKKPLKRKPNLKIDGAVVTLMNFWLFNNYEQI